MGGKTEIDDAGAVADQNVGGGEIPHDDTAFVHRDEDTSQSCRQPIKAAPLCAWHVRAVAPYVFGEGEGAAVAGDEELVVTVLEVVDELRYTGDSIENSQDTTLVAQPQATVVVADGLGDRRAPV